MKNFAKRLKQARRDSGLTLMDIAIKTRVDNSRISKYERGEIYPGLESLYKLAKAYDVSVDWLLGLDT